MALTIFASVIAAAATKGTVKTATAGSSVTLRAKASTSAKKVTSVKDGTSVEVIAKSGNFYKVKVGKNEGYIQKDYVKLSGSSSSGSSSSTNKTSSTDGKLTGTLNKAAYVYQKANTKSTKVATLKKGATVEVTSQTTSYYKVKTSAGKVGYIPKKYVNLNQAAKAKPGDPTGVYKNASITKPADVVSTKLEVWNAISYNLTQFKTSFTINIRNFSADMIPTKLSDLEYAFVEGDIGIEAGAQNGDGTTPYTFTVKYNPAGRVLDAMQRKVEIPASDSEATELKKVVDKVVATVNGKSEYQKAVALHDYVVLNVGYDTSKPLSAVGFGAYGGLVKGISSCQGYMESIGLLYSAAGLENRMVWANSKVSGTGTHGFNKVKVDGKWYNVDATVDDPNPNVKGRLYRGYLLVTDKISAQRYDWDSVRYPAATTKNSWHYRNKQVATSQSELEALVKKGVANKEKYVTVWVEGYSSSKYKTGFASKLSGVKSVKASRLGVAPGVSNPDDLMIFMITYK